MVKLQIIKFNVAYASKEGKRHKYHDRCRLLLWSSDSERSSHELQFQTECGPHRTKLGHSSTMIQSIKLFTCEYAYVHQTQLVQVLESIEAWINPIVVKLGMPLGTKKCQVLRRSRFAEWWDYPATEWSVVWGNDGGVPMAVFLFHEYAWSFEVTHIVGEYERVRDLMRRMALRVVAMGLLSLIWSAFTVVAKFSPPSAPDPGQLRLRSSPGSYIRHQLLVL